ASPTWKTKRVSVEFDGIAGNATVFLNGKKLGIHPYAYTSFRFDVTPDLDYSKKNVLAVRVDNSEQPGSRWYSGSGIYQHVRIIVPEPVHVSPWGVFVSAPEASTESAKVLVRTQLQNDSQESADVSVRTTLISHQGKDVAKTESQVQLGPEGHEETSQQITLAHPALWSTEEPALYSAVTEIVRAGNVIDRVDTN